MTRILKAERVSELCRQTEQRWQDQPGVLPSKAHILAGLIEDELLAALAEPQPTPVWLAYHSALSQCAELLDNMTDGDLITDTPRFLKEKLIADLRHARSTLSGTTPVYKLQMAEKLVELKRLDAEIDRLSGLALATPQPAVPEGWKLVPINPTEEMIAAFGDKLEGACGGYFEWERGGDEGYAAMLAAAPTPITKDPS